MSQNQYLVPLSIIVAGILIAGAVFLSLNSDQSGRLMAENNQPQDIEIETAGWPALGDPNAPITIIEYSDYACPFCGVFWEETLPLLKANYIETGKVYFVYKDFAVVGGEKAAEAAHCAADQDAYWDYHDLLFTQSESDRGLWSNSDTHLNYAETLGLDADELIACFESGKYQTKVDNSTEEAIRNGVGGTPHFFINDQELVGAQPYQVFEGVIENILSEN